MLKSLSVLKLKWGDQKYLNLVSIVADYGVSYFLSINKKGVSVKKYLSFGCTLIFWGACSIDNLAGAACKTSKPIAITQRSGNKFDDGDQLFSYSLSSDASLSYEGAEYGDSRDILYIENEVSASSPMSFTPSISSGLSQLGIPTEKNPSISSSKKYHKFITETFIIPLAMGNCDNKDKFIAGFFTTVRKFHQLRESFGDDKNDICNNFSMVIQLLYQEVSSEEPDERNNYYRAFIRYFEGKLDRQVLKDLKCASDKRLYLCALIGKELGLLSESIGENKSENKNVAQLAQELLTRVDALPESEF